MPQFVEGGIVGGVLRRRAHLVREVGRGLRRGAVERLKVGDGESMTDCISGSATITDLTGCTNTSLTYLIKIAPSYLLTLRDCQQIQIR